MIPVRGDDMTNRTDKPLFCRTYRFRIHLSALQSASRIQWNICDNLVYRDTGLEGWAFTPPAPWGDDHYMTVTVEDRAGIRVRLRR